MKPPNQIFACVFGFLMVFEMSPLVLAQIDDANSGGYQHDINITGKQGGPYNIKATVEPVGKLNNVPMGLFKKGDTVAEADKSYEQKRKEAKEKLLERLFGESAKDDVPLFDPNTTAMVNDLTGIPVDNPNTKPSPNPTTTPTRDMGTGEDHHAVGGEDHHHGLPTDGSPNATDITQRAIETFYDGLPRDITNTLAGMGSDPMATVHSAGDPYVPYAIALQSSDFNRMRDLANSDAVTDFNQRIAMLGLAGATALRNLSNPKKNIAARDTLNKVADDLHYAGEGLDASNAKDAKLKAICEDISRIWSNVGKPPANK